MNTNQALRQYVRELRDISVPKEKRRELVETSCQSQLERELAKLQFKTAAILTGSAIFGAALMYIVRENLPADHNQDTARNLLIVGTGMLSGAVIAGCLTHSVQQGYRSIKNYINSFYAISHK